MSIFSKSFLVLLKAVKAARGGKYVHREFAGTSTDKKGKIKNKWHYFYNQGTLQKELAAWKAGFEKKQAKQKKNLFATHADIKGVIDENSKSIGITKLKRKKNTQVIQQYIDSISESDKQKFIEYTINSIQKRMKSGYKYSYMPSESKQIDETQLKGLLDNSKSLDQKLIIAGIQANIPSSVSHLKAKLDEMEYLSKPVEQPKQVTPISFDAHIAHLNLSDSQKKAAHDLLVSLKKDTPEFAKTRIERFKTMPGSYRAVGEAVASYFEQGHSLSEAMQGNDNAKGSQENNFDTMPESIKSETKEKIETEFTQLLRQAKRILAQDKEGKGEGIFNSIKLNIENMIDRANNDLSYKQDYFRDLQEDTGKRRQTILDLTDLLRMTVYGKDENGEIRKPTSIKERVKKRLTEIKKEKESNFETMPEPEKQVTASELLKAYRLNQSRNNFLTLLKGKKAQEGEVRTWGNGKQFKKVGGKWQPVAGEKKKKEPKAPKEKKKESSDDSQGMGFSYKPFSEIKRIMQYTAEKDFDQAKVEQYYNSIKDNGYDPAFPMVIDTAGDKGGYNVVAGNHRYKAVKKLIDDGVLPKDFKIPTILKKFDSQDDRDMYQIKENERRIVNPTDDAKKYREILDRGKTDIAGIAKNIGKPVGDIKKLVALTNLSPELFDLVKRKDRSLPVGIGQAIGMNAVDDDGKPNHTIQLKAYQFYRDNKGKGYGAGEVLSFIRELKSNSSQKFFENDGKSDTEKEALRNVGSEEKAKRNVKLLDTTFKTMQTALSRLMGDGVGQINPKLAKELSSSIVAAQGESEFANKMAMLDTVIQDMQLMKEAFMKSFKGIKDDSSMGMMFASNINSMIHHVNKHTKAIETAKAINKMLSLAYKAKYKLHDSSVKAKLAA